MTISVVLVDDQTLVREGIRHLIQLNKLFKVIGEASDGKQALNLLNTITPDVVLLDIRMPIMSGVDVLRQLKEQSSNIAILVLTTFDDHDLVLECIKLGAKGYLRKDVNFNDLTLAINTLAEGGSWLQPAISERITEHFKTTESSEEWQNQNSEKLSTIELQVLKLVAAGYSNHEIADALYKSVGTVRNQVSSILLKLDVRDRTRAVLKALDLGVI